MVLLPCWNCLIYLVCLLFLGFDACLCLLGRYVCWFALIVTFCAVFGFSFNFVIS